MGLYTQQQSTFQLVIMVALPRCIALATLMYTVTVALAETLQVHRFVLCEPVTE